ncbi:response regulator [Occallatibacter riparius]|uniref:Response regulator n=1 Tax=Occallatibacter riparius TaxID=1002689 RepID=A0A9J7BP96_9BACT|nr:response regulator [Occallatibacter riparius]UWZ84439.1 response regulator [Occallatibacter riparius]
MMLRSESRALRVLIVDHQEAIAETLAMIVKGNGHSACIAHSAEQATGIFPEFRPEVVISDVMLPGMDGVQFAAWLKDRDPNCAVLLISGHPDTSELCNQLDTPRPRFSRSRFTRANF